MAITSQEIQAKVDKLSTNMDRLDSIINGDATTEIPTDNDVVPSIAKFLADKDSEINSSANSILEQSNNARDKAAQWAEEDVDVPVETDQFSAKHHATKAEQSSSQALTYRDQAAGYAAAALNEWVVSGPFTGTGEEEDYLLLVDPGSVNNTFVSVGGVFQFTGSYDLVEAAGSHYIRINVPLDVVFEVRSGNAVDVNTPSAGSVTRTSLAVSATVEGQINAASDVAFSDADMLTARKASDGSLIKRSWAAVKAALISISKPRFLAKNTANQTGIASNTPTKILFPSEMRDVGGYYDPSTSRWTPPAGAVSINANVHITGTLGTTAAYAMIYKNGTLLDYGTVVSPSGGFAGLSIKLQDDANGTDYYEVFAYVPVTSGTAATNFNLSRFEGFSI